MVLWTPLHAELGHEPGPVTYEMLCQACEQGVVEQAGLDWKRDPPLSPAPDHQTQDRKRRDLASDLAAMANSGGGLIVYGVDESRGSGVSAANKLIPFEGWNEQSATQVRQVAATWVHPPLIDLEVTALTGRDASEVAAVMVWVSDSLDAPHLVVSQRSGEFYFAAPYRAGADTLRMTERQLEVAYRQRLFERRRRRQELSERYDELAEAVLTTTPSGNAWFVALASPQRPQRPQGSVTPQHCLQLLTAAWSRLPPNGSWSPACELNVGEYPRRGLRRAMWRVHRAIDQGRTLLAVRVEIHDDGTIGLACSRGGPEAGDAQPRPHRIVREELVATIRDLGGLIARVAADRGVGGDYQVRAGIPIDGAQLAFATQQPGFIHIDDHDWHGVYRPVEAAIITSLGDDDLAASMHDLATDVLGQAYLPLHQEISYFRPAEPDP